jgi:hypothetical protein
VDIWFFFKTRLRTTEIYDNLDTTVTDRLTAHRQTDQRALVEIIQRPSVRAGSPIELSVRPTVRAGSAGELKRGTVALDRQTHALREFIYKICGFMFGVNISTLGLPHP